MALVKAIFGKTNSVDPITDEIKKKINQLIISHLDNYEKNYNRELYLVYKEWKTAKKKFTFEELDQEAHNRAGVKSLKETITNKTWSEIEDDVDKEVKTKSNSDTAIKISNIAGKKTVGVMVSKSVDESIVKITKKAETKKKKT